MERERGNEAGVARGYGEEEGEARERGGEHEEVDEWGAKRVRGGEVAAGGREVGQVEVEKILSTLVFIYLVILFIFISTSIFRANKANKLLGEGPNIKRNRIIQTRSA